MHTTPYVAKELGLFAKHCIDANIIQFDGGGSPAAKAAAAQGTALVSVQPVAIGHGVKAKQIWRLAPRTPQAYVVAEEIKTAADLKGKRLSAAGGGVGSFNWLMGREVLKSAGLEVDDAQFCRPRTAAPPARPHRRPDRWRRAASGGRLPRAAEEAGPARAGAARRPAAELRVQRLWRADDWVEQDRPLMVDTVAAMIEANRAIYRDKDKVVPIMVKATGSRRRPSSTPGTC